MSSLSICLPSNRNLEQSAQTIDNLYNLCENPDIEASISDNSGDERKKLHYKNKYLSNFKYTISPYTNAFENWRNALNTASGKYISFLSDDDLLIQLPGSKFKKLNIPKNTIGIRPHMALFNEQHGLYNHNSFEISDNRAIDRVKKYIAHHNGTNTTLFSFFQNEIISDYISEFCEIHPTRGSYTDWAMVFGFISMGPLIKSNDFLYIYNDANWCNQENINKNIKKTFSDAGLPEETAPILPLLNALDSFATICRASSTINSDEKLEAANYVLSAYFKSFADFISRIITINKPNYKNISNSQRIISNVTTETDMLAASLLIVDIWLPGYADKYHLYFKNILDKTIYNTLYF